MNGSISTHGRKGQSTRKPMARVTRVALFQREIRERLSDAALHVLLAKAEVISEGQVAPAGMAKYYGSTMLTMDLALCTAEFREMMDAATALRVAEMLRSDRRFKPRLRDLARREAERVADAKLKNLEMEVKVDVRGPRVLVDLDVEATVASSQHRSQARLG